MTVSKPQKPYAALRRFTALLACAVLLMTWFPGLAENNDPNGVWNDYNAEDADISTIVEKDGRLTGTLKILRFRDPSQVLKVDCPVPQAFTQEQLMALRVVFEPLDKGRLLNAMEQASSAVPEGAKVQISLSKTLAYCTVDGYPEQIWPDFPDDPIAQSTYGTPAVKPDEQGRAKEISLAFARSLGFEPYVPGMNIDRVFTPMPRGGLLKTSDYNENWEKIIRSKNRNLKEWGKKTLDEADLDYTAIELLPALRGLPVARQYYWPGSNGPDSGTGGVTGIDIRVKDGGGISYAEIYDLPREVSATPLSIAPVSWQDALKEWLATFYVDSTTTKDVVYDGTEAGNNRGAFTLYASYSVLTEIKPVYVSMSKQNYTPGWCFVVEERLAKDDTLIRAQTYTLDMVTMKDPIYPPMP